ncbi:DUF4377 domain-containing protein [Flavobacterium columnare]|uniref:DUF4377 domain-containing protein n=2 Tax=Flavobacterium TaxID=237 RepID=A0A2N9PDL3_9FLAO|nr:DUF4377 domain-containing protein [Flavobacterium columnare]RVU90228.1 DUF4377 domain-containing protein [Flavobacterium columnare]SPE78459.1 hypothetical protein FLACOL_02475 [Flavobacterium columnare]
MVRLILSIFSLGLTLISCNTNKDEKTVYIGANTTPCNAGVMETECLQIKWSKNQKEWDFFYNTIQGFKYEKGNEYELVIKEEKVENPPADGSNVKYTLIKEVSKKRLLVTK